MGKFIALRDIISNFHCLRKTFGYTLLPSIGYRRCSCFQGYSKEGQKQSCVFFLFLMNTEMLESLLVVRSIFYSKIRSHEIKWILDYFISPAISSSSPVHNCYDLKEGFPGIFSKVSLPLTSNNIYIK